MILHFSLSSLLLLFCACIVYSRYDEWNYVPCNKEHQPENCDLENFPLVTVDDYDRCAPAKLPLNVRNFFLGATGRRITYMENKDAFDRIKIVPKYLRDVSNHSIETSVLGLKMDFPIGISPAAFHALATPEGELATVKGISNMKTVMIVSAYASKTFEDIAKAARGSYLWMQVYIYTNRSLTIHLVRKAEKNGFKGIVVTADYPYPSTVTCNGRDVIFGDIRVQAGNIDKDADKASPAATFKDISWLKRQTKLPIIVKGLMSGDDAKQAILAGASAILVSNHGGRQLDGDQATIEALPGIVDAVNKLSPRREVFMDGGIRSGNDVYKAIARGAKMVFVGRPIIWGLALGGAEGVTKVMNTLKAEFNMTMILAGYTKVSDIRRDSLIPQVPPDSSKSL